MMDPLLEIHDQGKKKFFDTCSLEEKMQGFTPEERTTVDWIVHEMKIVPGMVLFEAGCGTGRLTEILAALVGEEGRIHALDLSPKMIEHARSRRLGPQVEWLIGDVAAVPLPDARCDIAICFNALPHFSQKERSLKEIFRLLKPEGKLFIAHSKGRAEVNAIHHQAGGAVAKDQIPDARFLYLMLEESGFNITRLVDAEDRYFAEARRKAGSPHQPLVLGIVASPRRGGNTHILVNKVLEGAEEAGLKVEQLFLHDLHINPCQSCFRCFAEGRCVIEDGMSVLYRLLPKAQVWVLGTPVYLSGYSAQMKLFIDRLYPFVVKNQNRNPLDDIEAILVHTQGHPDALKYEHLARQISDLMSLFFGVKIVETIFQCGNHHQVTAPLDASLLQEAKDKGFKVAGRTLAQRQRPMTANLSL